MENIIIVMYRPGYEQPTEFKVLTTTKGLEFWIDRAVRLGFEPAWAEQEESAGDE